MNNLWVYIMTNGYAVIFIDNASVGSEAAEVLRHRLGARYFGFLSAIDWMPSPYGKSEEDPTVEKEPIDMTIKQGICGGETCRHC